MAQSLIIILLKELLSSLNAVAINVNYSESLRNYLEVISTIITYPDDQMQSGDYVTSPG